MQRGLKKKRPVHFLAPYRAEHAVKLAALTGIKPAKLRDKRSLAFHKAVAAQRLYKTPEEVADIEMAVDVSREMYAAAMRAAKPGLKEHQIVAEIAKVVMARGCTLLVPADLLGARRDAAQSVLPEHAGQRAT